MHHRVTLVSRRACRKLLSTHGLPRLSISSSGRQTLATQRVSVVYRLHSRRGEKSTNAAACDLENREKKRKRKRREGRKKRKREERRSDRNAKRLKRLRINYLSLSSRSFLSLFLFLHPFCPSFSDDVRVVVSPISHYSSIVNQNAALPGTKVPNKIHKFPLYYVRGGFRQKFSKFRKQYFWYPCCSPTSENRGLHVNNLEMRG